MEELAKVGADIRSRTLSTIERVERTEEVVSDIHKKLVSYNEEMVLFGSALNSMTEELRGLVGTLGRIVPYTIDVGLRLDNVYFPDVIAYDKGELETWKQQEQTRVHRMMRQFQDAMDQYEALRKDRIAMAAKKKQEEEEAAALLKKRAEEEAAAKREQQQREVEEEEKRRKLEAEKKASAEGAAAAAQPPPPPSAAPADGTAAQPPSSAAAASAVVAADGADSANGGVAATSSEEQRKRKEEEDARAASVLAQKESQAKKAYEAFLSGGAETRPSAEPGPTAAAPAQPQ